MKFVFVADLFAEQYSGGAELSTAALFEKRQEDVIRINSNQVTEEVINQLQTAHWVFFNFSAMNLKLIPQIMETISYSIVEYDYKFCVHRSIEKHKEATGNDCDCHSSQFGNLISLFFQNSNHIFWMSAAQRNRYFERFPELINHKSTILSSLFSPAFFDKIEEVNKQIKNREGWLVLGSKSWIKGQDAAIKWCQDNNKSYEVVWDIPYNEMLDKMSNAEGFVYLPVGGDTCPRIVIEAKLLGCEVVTNENVQHANETWFLGDPEFIRSYLEARPDMFWDTLDEFNREQQSLSGYTTTYNCVNQNYPFFESITSLLDVCDEVCVVDGGSTDGTWDVLNEMAAENKKLKIKQVARDWNHNRHAVFDGLQKAEARLMCTKSFCWQQDVDEIIHENDYAKIKDLLNIIPKSTPLVALPVIEFWGNKGKIRVDINPWKWRLSRNNPLITHGIPAQLRRYDENGDLYSSPGSDGCDYISKENGQLIQFVSFHTQESQELQRQAQTSSEACQKYVNWFAAVTKSLPGVYHYSWFNLPRKINTYKNYWSKHWQSLFNIKQEDSAENNMFFDKRWEEVTSEDILQISERLQDDMGGWIFHRKIDWKNPTPSVIIEGSTHPEVMSEWVKSE